MTMINAVLKLPGTSETQPLTSDTEITKADI